MFDSSFLHKSTFWSLWFVHSKLDKRPIFLAKGPSVAREKNLKKKFKKKY